jgi:hypothetical protein
VGAFAAVWKFLAYVDAEQVATGQALPTSVVEDELWTRSVDPHRAEVTALLESVPGGGQRASRTDLGSSPVTWCTRSDPSSCSSGRDGLQGQLVGRLLGGGVDGLGASEDLDAEVAAAFGPSRRFWDGTPTKARWGRASRLPLKRRFRPLRGAVNLTQAGGSDARSTPVRLLLPHRGLDHLARLKTRHCRSAICSTRQWAPSAPPEPRAAPPGPIDRQRDNGCVERASLITNATTRIGNAISSPITSELLQPRGSARITPSTRARMAGVMVMAPARSNVRLGAAGRPALSHEDRARTITRAATGTLT